MQNEQENKGNKKLCKVRKEERDKENQKKTKKIDFFSFFLGSNMDMRPNSYYLFFLPSFCRSFHSCCLSFQFHFFVCFLLSKLRSEKVEKEEKTAKIEKTVLVFVRKLFFLLFFYLSLVPCEISLNNSSMLDSRNVFSFFLQRFSLFLSSLFLFFWFSLFFSFSFFFQFAEERKNERKSGSNFSFLVAVPATPEKPSKSRLSTILEINSGIPEIKIVLETSEEIPLICLSLTNITNCIR